MKNPFEPGYYSTDDLRGFGFASVGDNVQIARNCTIIGLANISIGDHVRIDGYTSIIVPNGRVSIGSHIHICIGCVIGGRGGVVLSDFVGLSQRSIVLSASDDYSGEYLTNSLIPSDFTNVTIAPVHLGRHVIVGAGSVVLPGADIGEGTAVGSLSLVSKPLDPWGIYAGTPAKRIKARSTALLSLEAELLGRAHAA